MRDAYDPSSQAEWLEKAFSWKGSVVVFAICVSLTLIAIVLERNQHPLTYPRILFATFLPLTMWHVNRFDPSLYKRISPEIELILRTDYGDKPAATPVVVESERGLPFRSFGRVCIPQQFVEQGSNDALIWSLRSHLDAAQKVNMDQGLISCVTSCLALYSLFGFHRDSLFRTVALVVLIVFFFGTRVWCDRVFWICAKQNASGRGAKGAREATEYAEKIHSNSLFGEAYWRWKMERKRRWMGVEDA